jgi:DHA2 family multidrug resistance protein
MVMMFIAGRLVGKLQPKYLIVAGALIMALSMYPLTNVYGDLGFWFMARSRMLFAAGFPLMFISVTAASYDGTQYQDTLHQMTNYFVGQGSPLIEAQHQTITWVGQQVQLQASFLAYMDAFWVLTLLAPAAVPLALSLREVKLGAGVRSDRTIFSPI